MRMTAIHVQTERKRQDKSARCAEKHRRRAGMMRVHRMIRPVPGVCATADAARRDIACSTVKNQAFFTTDRRPLGECRSITVRGGQIVD
jgi:hypothetical protein